MEIGRLGENGARVIVITVLEEEQGTELDLVPIQRHFVMEGKRSLTINQALQWNTKNC